MHSEIRKIEEKLELDNMFDRFPFSNSISVGDKIMELVKFFYDNLKEYSCLSTGIATKFFRLVSNTDYLVIQTPKRGDMCRVGKGLWVHTKHHFLYSYDAGKTWFDNEALIFEDHKGNRYQNAHSKLSVCSFPYVPVRKIIKIFEQ